MSQIETMLAEIDARIAAEKVASDEIAALELKLQQIKASYAKDFGMHSDYRRTKCRRPALVALKAAIDGGAEVCSVALWGYAPESAAVVKRTAARVTVLTSEGQFEFDARTGEGRGDGRGWRIVK